MATVGEIERLKALVDRLLPLASRARGEIIAADDWNTVVGALLEVARAVVDTGPGADVPPHDHPDQVRAGWLEPRLRAAIERGPLDDPVAVARISAVERGVGTTDRRLDALTEDLRAVRQAASRVEVSDLGREAAITRLTRKVDGVGDTRDDVTALRDTLDALRTEVAAVTTFAHGLAGVTPAVLLDGLTAVNDLRTRLTTATGSLLDAAEFERRLTELATTLVTEEELTEALGTIRLTVPPEERASLLEDARGTAQRQSEATTAVLGEQLRAQIAERLADVEESAVRAAVEAVGEFRDALRDSLRDELGVVVAETDAALRAELTRAVTELNDSLRRVIDEQAAALREWVAADIRRLEPELTATISAAVAEKIDAVAGRVGAVERHVDELRRNVTGVATDLAALRQSTSAELERTARDLRAGFDRDLRAAEQELSAAQAALGEALRGELAAERLRVDKAIEEIRSQIPPRVGDVLTRADLAAAVSAETDRLRADLLATVNTRVDERLRTLPDPSRAIGRARPVDPIRPAEPDR